MNDTREKKIKALQDWYKHDRDGFELSAEDAETLLSIAEYWGASLLCAAYDIVVDGYTYERNYYVDIKQC